MLLTKYLFMIFFLSGLSIVFWSLAGETKFRPYKIYLFLRLLMSKMEIKLSPCFACMTYELYGNATCTSKVRGKVHGSSRAARCLRVTSGRKLEYRINWSVSGRSRLALSLVFDSQDSVLLCLELFVQVRASLTGSVCTWSFFGSSRCLCSWGSECDVLIGCLWTPCSCWLSGCSVASVFVMNVHGCRLCYRDILRKKQKKGGGRSRQRWAALQSVQVRIKRNAKYCLIGSPS